MIVKITTCKDAFEGEVVKGLLADNGIDCHLQNETMSQIYGGVQAMAINVLVREEDAEKAKELLNSRPQEGPIDADTPQQERKSIKRILLESFLVSVCLLALFLLNAWLNNDFQSFYQYALFAGCFFIGYTLIALLFRMRRKEKSE